MGSWLPVNLKCQSMKELLNFLDLLPLRSNHSFMPMGPGLVFFTCDSGAMGIEVGAKRQHKGTCGGMSHSLCFSFSIWSLTRLNLASAFIFLGPGFPGCIKRAGLNSPRGHSLVPPL